MKQSYGELLKDPRWQKKRLEIMSRDNFTCQICKDGKSTLNVHHMKYDVNPWDVENGYLITLCQKCHKMEENINPFIIEIFDLFPDSGVLKNDVIDVLIAMSDYVNRIKEGTDREKILKFIEIIKKM